MKSFFGFFFLLSFPFFRISSNLFIFLDAGENLFQSNCLVCHTNGTNIILPEKNLKKEALEANGMNTAEAIIYQIVNGKNGMPAFSGRLTEKEIEKVAEYILFQSSNNFEK